MVTMINLLLALVNGPFGVLYTAIGFLVFALCQSKENEIYDRPNARFERIRQQLVQQVKENPDSKAVQEWVDQADRVRDLICSERYSDELSWAEKTAYILKPSYRNAHRMEALQKELESFAYNDLFLSATKLRG